jgi:hypothetical protein
MRSLEKFMDHVGKLLEDKPPYFLFIFVASALVFVSIITGRYFHETWTLFLYAAAGMMWRYFEKDLRRIHKKNKSEEVGRRIEMQHRIVYHAGNFVLFYFFVKYLGLI